MAFFHPLIGFLIPKAHAILSDVGSGGAGVDGMWESICSTLPFCGLGAGGPEFIVFKILDFIFAIIAGAAVLVIIWAGLKLIFAAGNEEAQGEAKKIILYALGGLILAILGETIKTFVVFITGTIFGEF